MKMRGATVMFRAIKRSITEGIRGMLKNGLMTITSVFVVTACIFVFGVFIMITSNINYMTETMANKYQMDVYVERTSDGDVSLYEQRKEAVKREIEKIDNIDKSTITLVDGKEKFKIWADLITSNIYALQKGQREAVLTNYYEDPPCEVVIKLDERLTPAQNAQKYYKKYNKAKTAESILKKQIELAESELEYIYTVFDSLTRCETESDITEVRSELYHSGYASKMKNYSEHKQKPSKPLEFRSSSGYRIGRNNIQNDMLTFKTGAKSDYWFHVKNAPGSHVVLMCNGEEPDAKDFTEAANIAACYSKLSDGEGVAVDYTLVKNVKKPNGAKPGYVIYSTNYTAYVTPDRDAADTLRV